MNCLIEFLNTIQKLNSLSLKQKLIIGIGGLAAVFFNFGKIALQPVVCTLTVLHLFTILLDMLPKSRNISRATTLNAGQAKLLQHLQSESKAENNIFFCVAHLIEKTLIRDHINYLSNKSVTHVQVTHHLHVSLRLKN